MSRRGARGFSLIELLVASVISVIVMMGLGSVFLTAFNAQAKSLRQAKAQAVATQVSKMVSRDVYQAHYISQPAIASAGAVLEGYVGIQKVGPGNVWSFTHAGFGANPGNNTWNRFLWCLSGTQLYRYQDSPAGMPNGGAIPSAIVCGSAGYTDVFGNLPSPPGLQVVQEPGYGGAFFHPLDTANTTGVFLHVQMPVSGPQPPVGEQVLFFTQAQVPNWTP